MRALLAIARTQLRRTMRSRLALAALLLSMAALSVYVQRIVWAGGFPREQAAGAVWTIVDRLREAGFILSALLGAWAIQAEVRERTWQTLLSKPVASWQVVGGKFLGVMGTLAVLWAMAWAVGHALLAFGLGQYFPRLDLALGLQLICLGIPLALVLCLSLRLHPIAAVVIVLLLRRSALEALFNAVAAVRWPSWALVIPALVVNGLELVAPSYEPFDLIRTLAAAVEVSWVRLGCIAGYGIGLILATLALACVFLRSRELTRAS